MDINFCSTRLNTTISSSAVSCEGYDVTNLLSTVPVLQSRGFLAEGFTKPPVSIYLKFFCNVDINHIILWVEVGCQKSNGIELIAIADSAVHEEKSGGERSVHNSSSNVNIRVGSCKFSLESGVVFQKYKGRISPKVPSNFLVKTFYTSASNVLRNCSDIEIKIFSTANSSVPALKKIEVWGRPGRYCSENVKRNIYTLWDKPTDSVNSVSKSVDLPINISSTSSTPSTSSGLCEPIVPEEYLDPITLNIMAIPMTLPSGKAVDLSTLEKFEGAESIWGRGPSDPFTGVPFTHSVFPVPDTALKSRIDQFLMENGHLVQFRGVGRTIGRDKSNLSQFAERLRKSGQITSDKRTLDSGSTSGSQNCPSSSLSPPSSLKLPVPEGCQSKESFLQGVPHGNASSVVQQPDGSQKEVRRGLKRKNDGDESSVTKGIKGSHMMNHEDAVEDSLDCALQSVLTGLPSFVKTTAQLLNESTEKTTNCECSHCLSEDCLFTLPCGHLLCRPCLVTKCTGNTGEIECEICHNQYCSSNVIRFHKS